MIMTPDHSAKSLVLTLSGNGCSLLFGSTARNRKQHKFLELCLNHFENRCADDGESGDLICMLM